MKRNKGESIKEWRDRVKNQKQEDHINSEIEKVKQQEDYGGELAPAVLTVQQNPATISQGYQTIGRKNNNHRVGQKSVFGERKHRQNRSLAERALNSFTDAVHLTSPPTFKDGYGRTLNAEVPLMESAQGQELKRMGKTAMKDVMIASAPLGLWQMYVNPLAMSAAIGTGVAVDQGTKFALNEANDKLRENGKEFSEEQQNAIRATVGLFSGNKAFKWGDHATKRGLEVAMHTTGKANPMRQIQDGWRARNWKQRGDVLNYILTGKNTGGNSNTLGWNPYEKSPAFYTGLNEEFTTTNIPEYGYDAVRAYLYNEPLLPFNKPADQSLGVHTNYVAKRYPNKTIPVYETKPPIRKRLNYTPDPKSTSVMGTEGSFPSGSLVNGERPKYNFDAAGHQMEFGWDGLDMFTRRQDIWKFNSKDYMDKWLKDNKGYGILGKLPLKWGLDITDYHGNPFIVRTPWEYDRSINIDVQ